MRLLAIAGIVGLALTRASEPLRRPARRSLREHRSAGRVFTWKPTRVVLGVAAVPPAYIPQTVETGSEPWRYWSKSGLVIKANSPPVDVSVPPRWRARVTIGWGNRNGSHLRFAPCPPSSALGDWNPYTGGFYLRSRSACVPLTFRVGDRSATVRFGVGKRCA